MQFQWTLKLKDGTVKTGTFTNKKEVHICCDIHGEIESFEAVAERVYTEGESIFMNGYQTWTYCPEYNGRSGIRGIKRIPDRVLKQYHLGQYGDYHFVDYPYKRGITHGFSWCYFRRDNVYELIGSLNERTGYTQFYYDANNGELRITKDIAGLQADGEYAVLDLYFGNGSENDVFDEWFSLLDITPRKQEKLFGYSSWYNRYQNIDEASIMEDLDGCKTLLKPGDLFQIDDGWEPFVGDWYNEDRKKFPHGMKYAVEQIHAAGFKAGLWLAPFVAETDSALYKAHPTWFLKVDGDLWCDGCNWSDFYSLDIDHPEVIAYLQQVFHRVYDEWGFDLVKLDFLYGAAPFGNAKETRSGRMYRALEMLRNWSGEHEILGCGVPVMPAFGIVDYCRVSCDVSLSYDDLLIMQATHRERTSTKQAIGNSIYRRELNQRAYLSDPDVFFLRDENIRLSAEQKHDLAMICALLGGVFLTSDNSSKYTQNMKEEYASYRYIAEHAHVLEVNTEENITIRYELDGEETVYTSTWKR